MDTLNDMVNDTLSKVTDTGNRKVIGQVSVTVILLAIVIYFIMKRYG